MRLLLFGGGKCNLCFVGWCLNLRWVGVLFVVLVELSCGCWFAVEFGGCILLGRRC